MVIGSVLTVVLAISILLAWRWRRPGLIMLPAVNLGYYLYFVAQRHDRGFAGSADAFFWACMNDGERIKPWVIVIMCVLSVGVIVYCRPAGK